MPVSGLNTDLRNDPERLFGRTAQRRGRTWPRPWSWEEAALDVKAVRTSQPRQALATTPHGSLSIAQTHFCFSKNLGFRGIQDTADNFPHMSVLLHTLQPQPKEPSL